MNTVYHCLRDGKQFGPLAAQQLQDAGASRALVPQDLVWAPGLPNCTAASQLTWVFPQQPGPVAVVPPGGDRKGLFWAIGAGAGALVLGLVSVIVVASGAGGETASKVVTGPPRAESLPVASPTPEQPAAPQVTPVVQKTREQSKVLKKPVEQGPDEQWPPQAADSTPFQGVPTPWYATWVAYHVQRINRKEAK